MFCFYDIIDCHLEFILSSVRWPRERLTIGEICEMYRVLALHITYLVIEFFSVRMKNRYMIFVATFYCIIQQSE